MASERISTRGGLLGRGRGGATNQIYYCFECDRTLTIIVTSDSGFLCPICGCVVLEEFETPSSSPPPPSPPRSTTLNYPRSFFPTSDTDSDSELSDPFPLLPPPPPPFHPFDGLLRPASPTLPPPPPVIDRSLPCPQFPVPTAPTTDFLYLSPPEDDDTTQYRHLDGELDALWPPPPPPPPPEHLLRSPPLSPSSSSDVWESFSPLAETVEEIPNQNIASLIQQPPLPSLPRPGLSTWDYFFTPIAEPELNSPNHQGASQLQPPPLPPWLQPPPMEGMLDMRMTEKLVSEWECHQCAICIENFERNQMMKLMPCKHLYHAVCILPWLDSNKSCPVCRYKLPSQ